MQFALSFDITALLFLCIVIAKFFSQRQYPLLSNRIFGWVLIAAAGNLLLDMGGTLSLRPGVPVLLAYIVNTLYYVLQIGLSGMLAVYILSRRGCRTGDKFLLLLVPDLFCEAALLCTEPFHLVFYIDPAIGYQHGPLYFLTYACGAVYMLLGVVLTLTGKSLQTRERVSILSLIGIIVTTMVVQYFLPAYCVTGTGIAAALVIVNFTIQDPGDMLDARTGAFNRGALLLYLQARLARKHPMQLIGAKLTGLRQVNALYGTREGDRLLAAASDFLGDRQRSWVFRLNDDSFVMAIRRGDSLEQQLSRLREWENRRWPENGQAVVHLHACCLPMAELDMDAEELANVLEAALRMPRNREEPVFRLEERDLKAFQRLNAIEKALRVDLPLSRGFRLVFQPIRDLETGGFRSAEALLRYENPALGTVSPDEFIRIAEGAGLAMALDEMVLRLAFSAVSNGTFQNMEFDNLHVNLSSASLAGESIARKIQLLQEETGVDPHFIVLEITETAAATAAEDALNNMEALRERGFRFAMDDFGTGYSSLTRLMEFPFSIVKLDRSLLQSNAEVYQGLVRIFRQMGMDLVAEGVENPQQAELVRKAGVRYIQGFLFAYPQTAEELQVSFGKTKE